MKNEGLSCLDGDLDGCKNGDSRPAGPFRLFIQFGLPSAADARASSKPAVRRTRQPHRTTHGAEHGTTHGTTHGTAHGAEHETTHGTAHGAAHGAAPGQWRTARRLTPSGRLFGSPYLFPFGLSRTSAAPPSACRKRSQALILYHLYFPPHAQSRPTNVHGLAPSPVSPCTRGTVFTMNGPIRSSPKTPALGHSSFLILHFSFPAFPPAGRISSHSPRISSLGRIFGAPNRYFCSNRPPNERRSV